MIRESAADPHLRRDRALGYLFITHDLSIVPQVTEHLYGMHRGRIASTSGGAPQPPHPT